MVIYERIIMEDKSKYFVVKQKAVPEVLLKVVEAKKLLETERALTVQRPRSGGDQPQFLLQVQWMIFFSFMTMQKEERSPLWCRWTMNRGA